MSSPALSVRDQLGYTILLSTYPRRIVSLVPSQTELLFDLGLDAEIVGITKFCIHPKDRCQSKAKVGGTKDFHLEAIDALKPDLIIGNKEENERLGIEKLREKYPVWISDIVTLDDALTMIGAIGALVGKESEAKAIANQIQVSFSELARERAGVTPLSVAYLIWQKPYMAVGSGTFIHEMLHYCGLENVFGQLDRYPTIGEEQLRNAQPDWIFLSTEPYPFQEKHLASFQAICPNAKVVLVDGELFSWYGSRLQYSASYFRKVLTNR